MKLNDYEIENLELVRASAAECTVLLRKNGAFPLNAPCKIAAFGSGVRHTITGGTGSGEVNSRITYNIEKGLDEAGFEITTRAWLDSYDEIIAREKERYIRKIKKEARSKGQLSFIYSMGKVMPEPSYELSCDYEGDACIYVLSRISGEGSDRENVEGDIKLTKKEIEDILFLDSRFEKFMLVLNTGGVVDLEPVSKVSNILLLSQLGAVTGLVLADILLGKSYPSGKLTDTWASFEDYPHMGDFGLPDDTRYREGIYVGYRFFETVKKEPVFPFGYGLSYTEFALSEMKAKLSGTYISAHAKVSNTGCFKGKEVLELYVSCPERKLPKAFKELAAFSKTKELLPSESDILSLGFDLKDFASYDSEKESYILEKGDYYIWLGTNIKDAKIIGIVKLSETATVLKARNVLGKTDFEDLNPMTKSIEFFKDIDTFNLNAGDIESSEVDYSLEFEKEESLDKLSNEELCYLNIGALNPSSNSLAVIGSAASSVAGAAGESSHLFTEFMIKPLVMADGPAGLRLSKEYYEDNKGVHSVGNSLVPEGMKEYMGVFLRSLTDLLFGSVKVPKDVLVKNQYATSIPVGTAVAQSFNIALAERLGDMVGSEMQRFNINLWLAPALNIHRDIRCGRNFEYYSEDPLISGLFAAAISRGVSKHKGCSVTIKHYAANSQETNRYASNSIVSERALREIYLKGFNICLKNSDTISLMTSYNLLNGIHTSEHKGLIEDVLRREYGFNGIIMTDWVISFMVSKKSKYRAALSSEVVKAGGDLFMPGSMGDYKRLLRAVTSGEVSRDKILESAYRLRKVSELLHN